MKQIQTHVWSLAGEEAVSYSLARGKAAAVTQESGKIAAYSRVGGHDTRELYTRGGSSRVNRDGRVIHRKQGGGGSYSQL